MIRQRHTISFGNCPTESSVDALKNLLALRVDKPLSEGSWQSSTSSRGISNTDLPYEQVATKKTFRVSSPQNPSPDSKNRSAKKSKRKSDVTTATFFAGSAFQNSPDPVSIPIPLFDDDVPELNEIDNGSTVAESISTVQTNKTELLRRLLKVQK